MRTIVKQEYPESAYCIIFGVTDYPHLPLDAEETLEYFLNTFPQREKDMFILRCKEKMTFTAIGNKYNLSISAVRQTVLKTLLKLRHQSRREIIEIGREAYLNLLVSENEAKKKRYNERISILEDTLKKQNAEISELKEKLIETELDVSIDILNLSIKTWYCLNRAGIKTVKQIRDHSNLRLIPKIRKISVMEVQEKMDAFIISVLKNM